MDIVRYQFDPDNSTYEGHHDYKDTAQVWVLHLKLADLTISVEDYMQLVAQASPDIITGEFVEHQWTDWGEDPAPDDWGLGIYFRAPTEEQAQKIGSELARQQGYTDPAKVVISTAGDWAEQLQYLSELTDHE